MEEFDSQVRDKLMKELLILDTGSFLYSPNYKDTLSSVTTFPSSTIALTDLSVFVWLPPTPLPDNINPHIAFPTFSNRDIHVVA